jgi:hypothetical protein
MLSAADPYSAFWTIATLVILFGLIPAILFLLGKASSASSAPDQEQMKEVRRLAVEIGQKAELMLTEGSHVFTGAPGERFALDVFIRFADSADQFRMMVLDPDRSSARARNAFRVLAADYERAVAAYPALKAYRQGQERLEKLGRCIEELKLFYDAQPMKYSQTYSQPRISRPPAKKQSIKTHSSEDLDRPLS